MQTSTRWFIGWTMLMVVAISAYAQVPNPQIPLTGNIGAGGPFPLLNNGTISFTSDTNHTMVYPETSAYFIKVTSTVSLTTTRNLVGPVGRGYSFAIENATTGSQAVQIIGASGTGVIVPSGQVVAVWNDGVNYIAQASGGSSIALQTNGTTNGSQSLLNLVAGANTTLTDSGTGTVTVAAASPPTLQTNGANNGSQSLLNLVPGTNVTMTNTGGAVTINATGGGTAFIPAANCDGGAATSSAMKVFSTNAPPRGCPAVDLNPIGYMDYVAAPSVPAYAMGEIRLPATWASVAAVLTFYSAQTTGSATFSIQTACAYTTSGSIATAPVWGTAVSVTTAVSGTTLNPVTTGNFAAIAANGTNGCGGNSLMYYRIFRAASDSLAGDAFLLGMLPAMN